jgi:hypothetical protein
MGVSLTFCLGWPRTVVILISTSLVGITGISHPRTVVILISTSLVGITGISHPAWPQIRQFFFFFLWLQFYKVLGFPWAYTELHCGEKGWSQLWDRYVLPQDWKTSSLILRKSFRLPWSGYSKVKKERVDFNFQFPVIFTFCGSMQKIHVWLHGGWQ